MNRESIVACLRDCEVSEVNRGVRIWSTSGQNMTLSYVELQPSAVTDPHRHENEQMNYILQGNVEAIIGDEYRTCHSLRSGDVIVVPPNSRHQFRTVGSEVAVMIGVLSPPRKP
jgi:quercetin dioxygenase-like cupin family protein